MAELTVHDTNGILRQPWVHPDRTSRGLGWSSLYVSTQSEQPYQASFGGAPSHLVILHRNGPVTVRRGHLGLTSSRTVPPGGLFVHPAGKELTVELGGALDTVHAYLTDDLLRAACDDGPVELAEELGALDPLVEQLMLTLDRVMREWEPTARTYVDHLGYALAAQLARQHSVRGRPVPPPPRRSGLTDRQLDAVRDMVETRLGEPLPLREMAAVTGLSVSQFGRQFKARTGLSPHQFLIQRRVDAAGRLLRGTTIPIAEVAQRCGFSHQEHLTRVLRAHLSITPAAMRVSCSA
ncbi:AraC family transcriptional regulator [Paractinoplanes abujensis]|uniref:AraC family transcriptional regulator n=1 Tax=Paractinoplanes abujensis TaxID=882441 RepID=A0A7W7G4D7_9ACTN|nr:AraC family transcriptional regulator [Actinoplanes abujensis]MBB4697268.1 AraC family transcriptional regulator [Actinoplanes abujensis]GID18256.1 AraC family transcriptional regulator [Actinoplanes abujensis]